MSNLELNCAVCGEFVTSIARLNAHIAETHPDIDTLDVTPAHLLHPELHWCGRILGCNVYVDTKSLRRRELVEKTLTEALKRLDEVTDLVPPDSETNTGMSEKSR